MHVSFRSSLFKGTVIEASFGAGIINSVKSSTPFSMAAGLAYMKSEWNNSAIADQKQVRNVIAEMFC